MILINPIGNSPSYKYKCKKYAYVFIQNCINKIILRIKVAYTC